MLRNEELRKEEMFVAIGLWGKRERIRCDKRKAAIH